VSFAPKAVRAQTTHVRRGGVDHSFTYGVDMVLIDPDTVTGPLLFSRNRLNLTAVHDRDHGGKPGQGRGAAWAREVLAARGLDRFDLRLLTQARFLGYGFNPVSFWLAFDGADLRAVIAEVSNTFGDRHSYVCKLDGFAPIGPQDVIVSTKAFHVSPFQDIAGNYRFQFHITDSRVVIRINHKNGSEGVNATLTGAITPLTNAVILGAALRRPFGPLRTVALIYWNALRLRLKGARYRPHPPAPDNEVSP
jgi:DUF1365 family protein